jgi:nucleotide-binding universal stress UspA family protein
MELMRHLLVPSDFSEPSRVALDYAAELARALEASIDVIHVWDIPTFIPPASLPEAGVPDLSLIEVFRTNAEEALAHFVQAAKARGIEVRASFVERGAAAHTITEFARKGKYDLIVIGTHGRTGLEHALIGSVAERVVRHASCPVLAVRGTPNKQSLAAE